MIFSTPNRSTKNGYVFSGSHRSILANFKDGKTPIKRMNMKSPIVFFVFCLTISGFRNYPETHGSVRAICIKNQRTGIAISNVKEWKKEAKSPEPWTAKQLMAPADLAAIINDPAVKKPIIICVGPGALIKGSLDVGPANEKENLEKLKQQLNKLSRDTDIVIYCGCCPFDHCPNIRPAFILLNEMKFNNARLLNLEHNIKTDWVAKGYPQAKA
jgi:thiosulfate/3-mercaptopyruvate sulfurtransferase